MSLGAANSDRVLMDTGVGIKLTGFMIDKLLPGEVYVVYGCVAPTRYSEALYAIDVPRPGHRAGISRVLGATLPWGTNARAKARVGEIFCGGMGGWSCATTLFQGIECAFALDNDEDAAEWFALNHGGIRVQRQNWNKLPEFAKAGIPVLTVDVGDWEWLQVLLDLQCTVFTASFPCGPWSAMGNRSGISAAGGHALLSLIQVLRLVQPVALILENVPGFRRGSHFAEFEAQLIKSGYRIVLTTMHDLQQVTFASRKRWMAIVVNTLYLHGHAKHSRQIDPIVRRDVKFDPKLNTLPLLSPESKQLLLPTEEEWPVLQQYAFVNAGSRGSESQRIYRAGEVLPTFTACYRISLGFDSTFLESKGLYAWLVDDAGSPRWFSAIEAAHSMGFPNTMRLPVQESLANRLVGNAVSPVQGALLLAFLEHTLASFTGFAFCEKFSDALRMIDLDMERFHTLQPVVHGGILYLCQPPDCMTPLPMPACKRPASNNDEPTLAKKPCIEEAPATIPFSIVLPGRSLVTGTSGVISLSGDFLPLRQMQCESPWDEWLSSEYPAISWSSVVVFCGDTLLQPHHMCDHRLRYTFRLVKLIQGKSVHDFSGFCDLQGRFHQVTPPTAHVTWQDWLAPFLPGDSTSFWVTLDGCPISDGHVLKPGCSYLLRLRSKLPGGAKDCRHKLQQHLLSRGVPSHVVEERVKEVMSVVTDAQLDEVYRTLEPWDTLKGIIAGKVRLVTPQELKDKKVAGRKASRPAASSDAPDPWLASDPWSEARKSQQNSRDHENSGPLPISILPEFFMKEDGTPPALISGIQNESCGVCLLSLDQIAPLVRMPNKISSHECAAIIISDDTVESGTFPSERIQFVATHPDAGKILLVGTLINFGMKRMCLKKPCHDFSLQAKDLRTITFEVSKDHCQDWQGAAANPMRFIWRCIEGSQSKVLSTWSRRFFASKRLVSAPDATTFHCFARVLESDVKSLLVQSGSSGIFVTPKMVGGGSDGCYRVVWLQTNEVREAMALARANSNCFGIVKGRNNLGLRVPAGDYATVRKAVEPDWSNVHQIRYQVKVSKRFVLSPVPASSDRHSLQLVLDAFTWDALPIRQLGVCSWLVGADSEPPADTISISGQLVIISAYLTKQPSKSPEGPVLAAPAAVKRTLQKQLRSGVRQVSEPSGPQTHAPAQAAPEVPPDDKIQALRDEFNAKVQAMSAHFEGAMLSVQKQAADVANTLAHSQAETRQKVQEMHDSHVARVDQIEAKIETISSSVCTKQDLSSLLAEALSKQSQEFRSMMAKRSPEPSPVNNEAAKAAKHS